ncbi:hypothetical protein SDC9_155014 [bioreactor metagenome]|uniref:Uncharacterized protein n=1 Tax=bioreactor metagenome TaxID=1076179 RepID=A0A645F2K5_9ZZZZ
MRKMIENGGINNDTKDKMFITAKAVHLDLRVFPFKFTLYFSSMSITPITILYEINIDMQVDVKAKM